MLPPFWELNSRTSYTVLYFAVPGEVVDLTMLPRPHSIIVEWKKPSYNGECVTRYDISWRHTESEQNDINSTTKEVYSLVIESLDACVQYDILVSAVNEKDESNMTTVSVTTETESEYCILVMLSYLCVK
jgi:hypothetical protein